MSADVRPSAKSWMGLAVLVASVWAATSGLDRWQDARAATAAREISQTIDVTVYTTSTCPYCAKAAAWLNQHGVRWRECNVDTTADCQHMFAAQGSPGVPLVRAGDRWHLGFHAPWLAEALKEQAANTKQDTPLR
jgi:glutaredoxin